MSHTPTAEGLQRYPPRGYSIEGRACECMSECPNPCLGACGCPACGSSSGGACGIFILFAIAGLNFVAFLIFTTYLGGDAFNGHAENGRYFVSNHGNLTEVSRSVFLFSYWHSVSVMVTHSLAFLAFYIAMFRWRRR